MLKRVLPAIANRLHLRRGTDPNSGIFIAAERQAMHPTGLAATLTAERQQSLDPPPPCAHTRECDGCVPRDYQPMVSVLCCENASQEAPVTGFDL